jgi:alpha-tubulin suppressor-like RCC1 family protein
VDEQDSKHQEPTQNSIRSHLPKRRFLRFASVGLLFSILDKLFARVAQAQTWQKIANPTGTAGTWQKLTIESTDQNFGVASVACGSKLTLCLRSDGLIFNSGENTSGKLGDGTTVSRSTFAQALGISNIVAIAGGGGDHTVALRADGLVFTTGANNLGQLGINSTTSKSTFLQATGISNAVAIAAGTNFTAALRADGFVFGSGQFLGIGDGTVAGKSTFIQGVGISNALAIASGFYHNVALRADGMVFATGSSIKGQTGANATGTFSTYVQGIGISNAIAIAATYNSTYALRSDGFVFSCGYNLHGQLGDNTTTSRLTFVQALGISNAIAISCGYGHALALRSDGLVFACGLNSSGQLGDGTTTSRRTFVQALGISNAIAIGTGGGTTGLALRSDGLVFGTGGNDMGQLADGTVTNRSTYAQLVMP